MGLLTGSVSPHVQNIFQGPMEAGWYPGDPADKWKKPKLIGPGILGKNLSGDGCGIGYHKNAAGQCVPDKDDVCPAGQTRNSAGVCVDTVGACPTGQERNSAGNCVPIKTNGCIPPLVSDGMGGCKAPTDDDCIPPLVSDGKGGCKLPGSGCIYGVDEWGNCIEKGGDDCKYGRYIDGRCKPAPLPSGEPGVGITVDGEVVQAPPGHYMPGHVGDPSYYMGADPNWAGGIDYPRSWQATTDPNTGLLRSAIYDDPAVVAAQEAMAALLSDMPESAAPTHFGTDQSLLDFGGDNVDAEEKAANNKANDAVRAAEKAESKASESGSDDDKKAANKAKRDADRAVADAAAARDDARIAAAAEASRERQAAAEEATRQRAAEQRAASEKAMADHWAWMAANEAQRKKDEENRLRNMGLLNTSNINTSNIWS